MEYNFQENKAIIRIKQIQLKNFKNIKDSKCLLITNKQENNDENSSILGLYGQNGSGKTAIIDSIHILKYAMSGESLPDRFSDCISVNAKEANLEYTFSLQYPYSKEQIRIIVYSFDLIRDSELSKTQEQIRNQKQRIGQEKHVRIVNEIISMGGRIGGKTIKLQPVIRTDTSPEPIGPVRKIPSLLGKTGRKEKMQRIAEIKQEAFSKSRSLLFSHDMLFFYMLSILKSLPASSVVARAFFEQVFGMHYDESLQVNDTEQAIIDVIMEKGPSAIQSMDPSVIERFGERPSESEERIFDENSFKAFYRGKENLSLPDNVFDEIEWKENEDESFAHDVLSTLQSLSLYASTSLYVVDTRTEGAIRLKQRLPFMTREKTFEIPLDSSFSIPIDDCTNLNYCIHGLNGVLKLLIPGLGLALQESEGSRAHYRSFSLFASRNENFYPLRFESDGVIRLISLLWLIIPAFNDRSFTLAVDEIDGGIYEYLLGDLLNLFVERGKGQLIFTSHNLRPLEMIPKDSIVFTTTNPDNRYVRLKGIGQTNNLRDVYLREIWKQESADPLYEAGDSKEIIRAIQKASLGFFS